MSQQLNLPKPGESVALSGGMLIGLKNGRAMYVTREELEDEIEWTCVKRELEHDGMRRYAR